MKTQAPLPFLFLAASFVLGEITVSDVRSYAIKAGETLYKHETHAPDANLTQLLVLIKQHKAAIDELAHDLHRDFGTTHIGNFSRPIFLEYDLQTVVVSSLLMEEFASRALCYREGGICAERIHYGDSDELSALVQKGRSRQIMDFLVQTETLIETVMKQTVPDQPQVAQVQHNCDHLMQMLKEAQAEAGPIVKKTKERLTADGDLVLRPANRIWVEVELYWYPAAMTVVDGYAKFFHDSLTH